MKLPKQMTVICAHKLFRGIGGDPYSVFNEETRHYERFVKFEKTGRILGPFLTLKEYKKAAIDSHVNVIRTVPQNFPLK